MAMNDDDFGLLEKIGSIFAFVFVVSICIADFEIFVIFATLIASFAFWFFYITKFEDSFFARSMEEDSGCNFGFLIMAFLSLVFLTFILFTIRYFNISLW